jgi:two-component system, LytTR family, response regulator
MQTIAIGHNKGTKVVPVAEIIRIQGLSNYCTIHFSNNEPVLTVAKLLRWFQQNLPADGFIRTHRTHLVNKSYIRKNMGSRMLLYNGETISISRRRKIEINKIAQSIQKV